MLRCGGILLAVLVGACGASKGSPAGAAAGPNVELVPAAGGSWSAAPVTDSLSTVANNGAGYTGEIDRYVIDAPVAGRLQVSLSWTQDADYDLIVSSDPEGKDRLAVGALDGDVPEYVGTPVAAGERVYVIVAGWTGATGDYTLETVLLPPAAPKFAVDSGPGLDAPWPANRPMTFTFNEELDPGQDVAAKVLIVGTGHLATGSWCIEGRMLTFYPDLPNAPGGGGAGLVPGVSYAVQFPRAAQGVRASSGEYLDEQWSATCDVAPFEDEDPAQPPRVMLADPTQLNGWDGSPLEIPIAGELDPDTIAARLSLVDEAGNVTPLVTVVQIETPVGCAGFGQEVLRISPYDPLPAGPKHMRLEIPGTVRGISGDPAVRNHLTGPEPEPPGNGFRVDFAAP